MIGETATVIAVIAVVIVLGYVCVRVWSHAYYKTKLDYHRQVMSELEGNSHKEEFRDG